VLKILEYLKINEIKGVMLILKIKKIKKTIIEEEKLKLNKKKIIIKEFTP
jgi:hypothetical protein